MKSFAVNKNRRSLPLATQAENKQHRCDEYPASQTLPL
jgi:hypothetical protein